MSIEYKQGYAAGYARRNMESTIKGMKRETVKSNRITSERNRLIAVCLTSLIIGFAFASCRKIALKQVSKPTTTLEIKQP